MGKGSAPTPPDPQQTAGAQTASNVSTAIANQQIGMVNESTPYGSRSYTRTGSYTMTDPSTGQTYEIPTYRVDTRLSDPMRAIQEESNRATQNAVGLAADRAQDLRSHLSSNVSLDGLPAAGLASGENAANIMNRRNANQMFNSERAIGQFGDSGDITRTYGTDFSADRQRVEEALMSRMNPSLARDQESLRTQLLNQGIREGSEAYDRAMNRFGEQANDARMQAVLAGGQEQSRLSGLEAARAGFENQAQQQAFGQDFSRAQFANQAAGQNNATELQRRTFNNQLLGQNESTFANLQAGRDQDRQQALEEMFAVRNQPINEISALLGTGQVTQPTFTGASMPTIPTTDVAGITMDAYNQQLGAYNTQQSYGQSLMGGLLGAGGSLGAAFISDRRLKADIRRIGQHGRLPVYEFRYRGGERRHVGYMAQDVMDVEPRAIVFLDGGFMAVDYDLAREAA